MARLKYTCTLNLDIDDQEYPIPVDGDFSTELYDISYQYLNDCLKAGLLFRREFYADKDVESSDSLMFRITLYPFGEARSPLIDR